MHIDKYNLYTNISSSLKSVLFAIIVFIYSFNKNVTIQKMKNIWYILYSCTILWFYKGSESICYNYLIPYKLKNYIYVYLKHIYYYIIYFCKYIESNYKRWFVII